MPEVGRPPRPGRTEWRVAKMSGFADKIVGERHFGDESVRKTGQGDGS